MKHNKDSYREDVQCAEKFVGYFCILCMIFSMCIILSCSRNNSKQYEVVVGEAYLDENDSENDSVSVALEQCLDDVQNKCKGVIDYALTLEHENARLHTLVQELKSERKN